MTIESWCEEFIPVPVDQVSEEDAIEHCLQRWIGFLPENLEKHGVRRPHVWDSGDCVLCHHWMCVDCPCVQLTGMLCSNKTCEDDPMDCLIAGDPTPGIMLLEIMLMEGY